MISINPTKQGYLVILVPATGVFWSTIWYTILLGRFNVVDSIAPTVAITGPTEAVTADFTATFTFSEVVSGFVTGDITVTNGTKGTFSETTTGKTYTLVVTPELGKTVSIDIAANSAQDAAGNGNTAATTFEVQAGSVASVATEFAKEEAETKEVIVDEVKNSLQNVVTANVRLVREAKARFIKSQMSPSGFVGDNSVPMDKSGTVNAAHGRLSTKGSFFEQYGSADGKARRLFFGDFSIVAEDGGSTTASLSGKVAWERSVSDKTMYGYFIGAEVNKTEVKTSFTGDQQGYGVNVGTYVVTELQDNVYLDGFISAGLGKAQLEMGNGTLSVDGDYQTRSLTLGGAVTGVYDMGTYEFWPELSATVGRTMIGDADFTGRAFGLVDNTLSLDAGDVTMANVVLRPEIRINMIEEEQSQRLAQFTYAPRLICERIETDTTVETCGRGAEIGFVSSSADGMTNITGRVMLDHVGSSTRRGLELKLQHQF